MPLHRRRHRDNALVTEILLVCFLQFLPSHARPPEPRNSAVLRIPMIARSFTVYGGRARACDASPSIFNLLPLPIVRNLSLSEEAEYFFGRGHMANDGE